MLPHEGLEILFAGAGTLFDKEIVELFSKTVAIYPIGITVYLNDGERCCIKAKQIFYGGDL
ncbi:hypothetical protein KHA80_14580 [Anaerobacillus sp. HL2]|nr:hypothetical protein KHA80_14580 [Anaerobacillus sp. HL2]